MLKKEIQKNINNTEKVLNKQTKEVSDNNIEKKEIKDYKDVIFTAKRKSSVCRIRISKYSKNVVNGKSINEYFQNIERFIAPVNTLLKKFELDQTFYFSCRVNGSGLSAQSSAIYYALGKLLRAKFRFEFKDEDRLYNTNNSLLRSLGAITLDRRSVEPKKYGLRKARRKRQRSKR